MAIMETTNHPFFDLVRRQRACRRFSTDPVDDDVVAAVLEAATYAPSAENTQPWEFVVVRDGEARRRIAEVHRGAARARAAHGRRAAGPPGQTARATATGARRRPRPPRPVRGTLVNG